VKWVKKDQKVNLVNRVILDQMEKLVHLVKTESVSLKVPLDQKENQGQLEWKEMKDYLAKEEVS
jgi:hypothetical protein